MLLYQRGILRIGGIVRHGLTRDRPVRVRHLGVLTQIRQRHDITGIRCGTCFVRHPDLNTVDGYTRGEVRQRFHGTIIAVAEIQGEEEVSVLLIVGGIELEGRCLHTALAGDTP